MVDRSKHMSMFQEMHGLYNSPGPHHILGSTIVAPQLLRKPALFQKNNSFQLTSTSPSSSSVVAPKKQLHPSQNNPRIYCIMQGTSQAIAALVAAPIERIFILMQCQNEMLKYGHLSSPYTGMKDCLLRTIKHEGVQSLWRGNSIRVMTPLTVQAFNFAVFHSTLDKQMVQEPPFWLMLLGLIPGLLFFFPLEYARVRLATDINAARKLQFSLESSGKSFSNVIGNKMCSDYFNVFKKTLKSDGVTGLYRGYTLALFGLSAIYYASSRIKSHYKTEKQMKESLSFSARVAPVALMSIPVAYYPVMSLTRRMMMTSCEATKYKGVIDAFFQIVKQEGASTLYKGFTPYMIYTFSKDATVFAFFYLAYSGISKLTERVSS